MSDLETKLLAGLKRAIGALNCPRNFRTDEGIKSYELIPQLERLVKEAESTTSPPTGEERPSC